jgi:hypothetical protein
MTTTTFRRSLATGFAAVALGAGAMLTTAGPASADIDDDGINMFCTKVTDAGSDANAAATLAAAGLKVEGTDKPVGFACTPVSNPADANFCANATAYNNAIAFGSADPCA